MSTSKKFTKQQLQAILESDHIRKHLIDAGLIDEHGEIIQKDERKRRARQQPPPITHPKSAHPATTPRSTKTKESVRSDSPDQPDTDRPKQTNKSLVSARSSPSRQVTPVQNVLLRRAVTPRTFPAGDRCLVTMMYFGPELNVEYDREWVEPEGDEIVIMQQHCGGGNLIAFKGFLEPNDVFSFESARHADYPFAMACYINGNFYNRLSVCCEARCKGFVRIGGRYGQFGIIDLQKEKPCRRCRYEQRMKKLLEADGKASTMTGNLCPKSTKASRLRSKSPVTRKPAPAAATSPNTKATACTSPSLNSSKTASAITASPKPSSKKTDNSASDSDSFLSDTSNHEPVSRPKSSSTTPAIHKPTRKDTDSDSADQRPVLTRKRNANTTKSATRTSEQSDSDSASRKLAHSRKPNTNTNAPSGSARRESDSDSSGRKLAPSRKPSSTLNTNRQSSSEHSDSDSASRKPVDTHQSNGNPSAISWLVSKDIHSDLPNRESSPSRGSNDEERHQSSVPSGSKSHLQSKANDSPNAFDSNLRGSTNTNHSTAFTARDNEHRDASTSNTAETGRHKVDNHAHPSIAQRERDSDDDNQDDKDDFH